MELHIWAGSSQVFAGRPILNVLFCIANHFANLRSSKKFCREGFTMYIIHCENHFHKFRKCVQTVMLSEFN